MPSAPDLTEQCAYGILPRELHTERTGSQEHSCPLSYVYSSAFCTCLFIIPCNVLFSLLPLAEGQQQCPENRLRRACQLSANSASAKQTQMQIPLPLPTQALTPSTWACWPRMFPSGHGSVSECLLSASCSPVDPQHPGQLTSNERFPSLHNAALCRCPGGPSQHCFSSNSSHHGGENSPPAHMAFCINLPKSGLLASLSPQLLLFINFEIALPRRS